jgi:glutamine---fructose-6-phosphate transaminase (isomerizing)
VDTCKKCILPITYPDLTFENNVCKLCESQENNPKINEGLLGEDELLKILISEKKGTYNCLVPISGGKDSCYALYFISEHLHLNPLAFFFDNGFTSEYARKNIDNLCHRLKIDLVVGKATEYRRLQIIEALHIAKNLGRFIKTCGNCENNLRTSAINEAIKRNIPFIVWGSTDFEDKPQRFTSGSYITDREVFGTWKSTKSKIKTAFIILLTQGQLINKCKAIYHAWRLIYFLIKDNIKSNISLNWKIFNPFLEVSFKNKKINTIFFYDYIKYDPYHHIEILENELGWKAARDKESRMDCKLHCFINYRNLRETGITADGFTLSVLIRNGLISKESALKKEETMIIDLEKECEELAIDLGVAGIFKPVKTEKLMKSLN